MKKLAIATLFALAAGTASAVDVGVVGGTDVQHGTTVDSYGLTASQHFGPLSATVGVDRETNSDTTKFSLLGGYDFYKFGSATVAAKVGVARVVNNEDDAKGYATLVGAGVTVPVSKHVGLTVDYRYQFGQAAIKDLNGSTVLVGAKYSF
jgi:outer membrane autotransporter protein